MKNIRLLSFLLLIFISGNEVYCQKIFRDGYVIKKNGESIYGLVGYSSSQDIPSKCIFKRFDIARVVEYSPETIIAFGYINGNRYESKELNNKSLFYEVLVTGKLVLYRRGSDYFIDKDHLGLVELKSGSIKYQTATGITEFQDLHAFLNYLTEGKSGNVSQNFNIKQEILALVTSYNKSTGNDFYIFNRSISQKQISQKALETGVEKSRFGLVGGTNIYMLKLTPIADYPGYIPTPEKESGMIFGITYERLLSRKSDRYSLKIDLLYINQTFYCYKEEILKNSSISRYDAFFNFTGIKVPVLFQYSLTGSRIIPYINAGFAYQYNISKDYLQIKEVENTLREIKTYEIRDLAVQAGEATVVTGIGLRTRMFNSLNLNIQGRFEIGTGFIERADEKSYHNTKPFKEQSMQATILLGITF